jgi:heat shock protein 1/8
VDVNGILSVSVVDEDTTNSNMITITNEKGGLSRKEIEAMMIEAGKLRDEDHMIDK